MVDNETTINKDNNLKMWTITGQCMTLTKRVLQKFFFYQIIVEFVYNVLKESQAPFQFQ